MATMGFRRASLLACRVLRRFLFATRGQGIGMTLPFLEFFAFNSALMPFSNSVRVLEAMADRIFFGVAIGLAGGDCSGSCAKP